MGLWTDGTLDLTIQLGAFYMVALLYCSYPAIENNGRSGIRLFCCRTWSVFILATFGRDHGIIRSKPYVVCFFPYTKIGMDFRARLSFWGISQCHEAMLENIHEWWAILALKYVDFPNKKGV